MSKTLSVKGWLECSKEDALTLQELTNKLSEMSESPIASERVNKYMAGWHIDLMPKNWVCYAFFGFDIAQEDEEFIFWMLNTLFSELDDLDGYFQIDDFDGDLETRKIKITESEIEV